MIKREELTNPNSCMSKARDDEMTFVLLGRDAAAPMVIRAWVNERIRLGKNTAEDPQIQEAIACAASMDAAAGRAPVVPERPMGFDTWWDGFRKWQGGWRFPAKDEPEHKITAYAAWQAAQSPITPTERLAWTREKPTREGMYWCKNNPGPGAWLESIFSDGDSILQIHNECGRDALVSEAPAYRYWYGPIEPPPFPESTPNQDANHA
jgi:hypothetical protein